MLLVAAVICLALSALAVGNVVMQPARNRRARIRSAATYGNVKLAQGPERAHFRERVVAPLVMSLARAMIRLNPKQDLESLGRLLMSAGLRNTSPQTFLAVKGAAAAAGLALGVALGASSSVLAALVFGLMLAAICYIAPSMVVSARARKRQSALGADLPDALDLLAVSVEAGLGFDGAVSKLTQYMQGPLVGGVRARARRHARRREPRRRPEEARRAVRLARGRGVRALDHPG